MTPFEFLAFTPKTNCGECGHPTCLAFAVAVTRGGARPKACPYIDLTALPEEFGAPAKPEAAVDERQRVSALADQLKLKIQDLDFRAIAPAIGATWSAATPDTLIFKYLDRRVELSKQAVLLDGENPEDPRDRILLYNYVFFGGGRVPDHKSWIGLESLPNSISKVTTLAAYCEQPLAKRFNGRADRLAAIGERLGARAVTSEQSATVGFIVPVLPMVPHYLLFWDGVPEEGFDARTKVLFDRYVLDFLDLESLVFAAERMADELFNIDSNL